MTKTKDGTHKWYCTNQFMLETNCVTRKVGLYSPLSPLGEIITRIHAAHLLHKWRTI